MTTWPSASKASTTNLDSGTDKPRLARADLKNNVDNVNNIIDYFNVSSATDGDMLVYNSNTAKVELGTSNGGLLNIKESTKETINNIVATSGSVTVDVTAAPVHVITINNNTDFNFTNMTAGTSVALIIKINANSTTVTFTGGVGATAVKFPGGAPTITQSTGNIDYVVVFYDGVDYIGNITQEIS